MDRLKRAEEAFGSKLTIGLNSGDTEDTIDCYESRCKNWNQALTELLVGKRVRRLSWRDNVLGIELKITPAAAGKKRTRIELLFTYEKRSKSGKKFYCYRRKPWSPYVEDFMADDWAVIRGYKKGQWNESA